MKAFIEPLAGIIRVGPRAERYGDPFDYAVAFSSVDGKTAVLKALVADGRQTAAHGRAAIAALKAIGLTAVWERVRQP